MSSKKRRNNKIDKSVKSKIPPNITIPSKQEYSEKYEKKIDILDKKDLYLCGIITLIFAVISIWNLGSANTPITEWKSTYVNESFYIDLNNLNKIDYIYIMEGVHPKIDFKIYSGSPNNWTMAYNASRENYFLSWMSVPINISSRYIRFLSGPKTDINEIIVYTGNYKKVPISDNNIICESGNCGNLHNLVDEQFKVEDPPSYQSGTMFDEIYFARTAYQHIIREAPFEYTHPPLGKLLMAVGILTFGLNAFGWRILPLLFGIAMIPIMYIFGKRVFKNKFGGFISAFLITFDGMHFVFSRIGLVDIILSTFITLMFYYFYKYYEGDLFKKSNIALLISGIFFGFAVSVKWTAIYGAFAIMVMFIILKNEELEKAKRNKIYKMDFIAPIMILLSFGLISFIIYFLSYIPIMGIPGEGSGLEMVLRYQQNMYRYHSTLVATHPFSSPWWSWIFMIKPVWVYNLTNPFENTTSNIVAIGNPVIWWTSIPFIIYIITIWLIKKDRIARFISLAFILQLVPYILIGRITFLYHMIPNIPFIILASVYCLNILWKKKSLYGRENLNKYLVIIYLAVVVIVFIYFYPILSGIPISHQFNDAHKWLSSWIF